MSGEIKKIHQLFINGEGQFIRFNNGFFGLSTPLLFTTSQLLKSFSPLLDADNPSFDVALKEFVCSFLNEAPITAQPISHNIFGVGPFSTLTLGQAGARNPLKGHETDFLLEIRSLRRAVSSWLDCGNRPELLAITEWSDSLVTGDIMDNAAAFFIRERVLQAPGYPCFDNGGLIRVHETDEILPLAWAEVWHALEYGIRLRICPYCQTVFRVPSNNPRKESCLSPACKKAQETNRLGGLENQREYWRNNKKKKGGKVGRPRKTN
ncbi:MAG: hypothetical protein RIN56_03170 [Sporomusaceae bacterium]|nr:hypothetical protein [Sporomusaceae bacterium]